jgi:hypothetical protein
MTLARAIVPEWGVRPGHNSTGSTIAAYTIVKLAGLLSGVPTITPCTAATDTPYGVTMHAITNGTTGDVQVLGKAKVLAGAQLSTVGTRLTSDSTGRAVAATVSAATVVGVIGQQATTSAAADDIIEVELMQHGGVAIGGSGGSVHLKLAIAYTTADAAVLYTLPARMLINRLFWEVTTSFTGGSSSAIGVSSDTAPADTKGDLLGGSGGNLAAALLSTGAIGKGGTIGTDFGSNGVVVLPAGAVIRFDRIVDAFTAGAGFVHVMGEFIS